jgi:hypothetical protein
MKTVKLLISIDMLLNYHVIAMKYNPELTDDEQDLLQKWVRQVRVNIGHSLDPNRTMDSQKVANIKGTVSRVDAIFYQGNLSLDLSTIEPKFDFKVEEIW